MTFNDRPCDTEPPEEREMVYTNGYDTPFAALLNYPTETLAESYWKLAHVFMCTDPLIYQKWLPLIEDPDTSFTEFVKRVQNNDATYS